MSPPAPATTETAHEAEGAPRTVDGALDGAMALAAALDARLVALAREGVLESWTDAGSAHAALVGAAAALGPRDWLFAGPRDVAAALARGVSLDVVLAHVFGAGADPIKGRVLPARLSLRASSEARGPIAGASFHNGAHLTHAAGVAWAAKIRKDPVVALAFLDEDELASGELHNAVNFAGVFRLPVVFVAVRRAASAERAVGGTIEDRGVAYGVPTASCDGADVRAVNAAARAAIERARGGGGATLLSAIATRAASANYVQSARDEANARVEAALARAEDGAPFAPETMLDDVYAASTLPWHLAEARDALRRK